MGRPRYRAQRHGLVRAVHHPRMPLPAWPDLTDTSPAGVASWCAWMREAWRIPELADAVRHASPSLAWELDELATTPCPDVATVRRMALALVGYSLRLAHRPTPFGLMAGVTEGTYGAHTDVRWGREHRAIARADGQWLAGLIQTLEDMPQVRRHLDVIANTVLEVRGDRLVLPWQPRSCEATGTALHEVSVRRTAAVRAAVQIAAKPVAYRDAAHKLTAQLAHPRHDHDDVQALLDLLIARRMLLTSLQPPATEPDALGHVVAELRRTGTERSATAAGLAAELRRIHELMTEHNRLPARASGRQRSVLTARMRQLGDQQRPLAVDVRLDAGVTLPNAVAWETETAAAILARVTPDPFGTQAWIRYRRRFQTRYGDNVLVPLLDLVNPHVGLGFPEDFLGSPRAPRPNTSRRDAVLLAHAQQAVAEGREVELDEELISQIAIRQPGPADVPSHLEILCEIHAAHAQDLDNGRFTLAVRRVGRTWGHLSGGRFAALLATDSQPNDLLGTLARRPTPVADALPVQLSFPALTHGATHLTRTPRLVAPLLSLQEHRPHDPDMISLDDLGVLCHDERLHLVSRSRGMVIETAIPHPLQLECHTPPLARFLDELQRGQSSRITAPMGLLDPWDWGAARHLPVRPRVRHGRSILSPATWLLHHARLPGKTASDTEWQDAFAILREHWRIPRHVFLERLDHRLRLDLDEPAHLAVLRTWTQRHHRPFPPVLTEAEPEDAHGWSQHRPVEFITLLASTAHPRPAPPIPAAPTTHRRDQRLPGASAYLSAHLLCQPQVRPALLTDHLPSLLEGIGRPTWWISPQTTGSEPGLLLTLRMPDTASATDALRHLGRWADQLVDTGLINGLTLRPYRPHLGTWGGETLLAAAENAWAADSHVLAFQASHLRDVDERALTAANLVSITTAFQGDTRTGMRWLAAQPKPTPTHPLPRDLVRQARTLADPDADWPALRKTPAGAVLLDHFWHRRTSALAAYRTALRHARRDPDPVLHALLNAHLNLTNTPQESAQTPWRLARDIALAAVQPSRQEPHATQPSSPEPPP